MSNQDRYMTEDFGELDLQRVKDAMAAAMAQDDTSGHPFFPNGDNWYVYGKPVQRERERYAEGEGFVGTGEFYTDYRPGVSFRNYCGTCELLAVNAEGHHVIYNKVDGLSPDQLAVEYLREIEMMRPFIEGGTTKSFPDEERRMYDNHRKAWLGTGGKDEG